MAFASKRVEKNRAWEGSAPTCYFPHTTVDVAIYSINLAEFCAMAYSQYNDGLSVERCHPFDICVSSIIVPCVDDKQK